MKIVYTCSYAYPSISGVWNRVENLAKALVAKGHEVHVLTSNLIAGTDNKASEYENYQGIHIHRFPVKFKLSKYQLLFTGKKFFEALEKINPDIIDCQTYRHPEAKAALSFARNNKIPCLLTTHAPFLPVEVRGKKLTFLSKLYDLFIGKMILKKYTKILKISDWETKYLLALGANPKKIIYSPNGVPLQFFKAKLKKQKNQKILFFGRIEPRKQVHILIEAFAKIAKKYPKATLNIIGPLENTPGYKEKLTAIINQHNLQKRVFIKDPIFEIPKKIKLILDHQIYVLPSTWEGFPQSLIEVMSLGKCIIASDCDGNKETIKHNTTGLLFNIGNTEQLAKQLDFCLNPKNSTAPLEKNAQKLAKTFTWKKISHDVEEIYKKCLKQKN